MLQHHNRLCQATRFSCKVLFDQLAFQMTSELTWEGDLTRWPHELPPQRGPTVFLVFVLSLMCLIYMLIYLINQGKTWPCSAVKTAGPCCPSYQWDQYCQYGTISLSPVKNINEWARSMHWETHRKVLRENWESNSLFYLLNSHSESKSFENLEAQEALYVIHSLTLILLPHIKALQKSAEGTARASWQPAAKQLFHQSQVSSSSFHTGKRVAGRSFGVCLLDRERTTQWPGKKWPLLTPYSEATWKEELEKLSASPSFFSFSMDVSIRETKFLTKF